MKSVLPRLDHSHASCPIPRFNEAGHHLAEGLKAQMLRLGGEHHIKTSGHLIHCRIHIDPEGFSIGLGRHLQRHQRHAGWLAGSASLLVCEVHVAPQLTGRLLQLPIVLAGGLCLEIDACSPTACLMSRMQGPAIESTPYG